MHLAQNLLHPCADLIHLILHMEAVCVVWPHGDQKVGVWSPVPELHLCLYGAERHDEILDEIIPPSSHRVEVGHDALPSVQGFVWTLLFLSMFRNQGLGSRSSNLAHATVLASDSSRQKN